METNDMHAGTRIVRSCELTESIWTQVGDLFEALAALTENTLSKQRFMNLQAAGKSRAQYQPSASGWLSTGYSLSFPVMEKKRRKPSPTAWINYQVSVFGDGIQPVVNGEQSSMGPVIHVSLWDHASDFDAPGMYVAFPPAWETWETRHRRLLTWDSEQSYHHGQWTFSIQLLALNSEDALWTSIIAPVQALLDGKPPEVALPDTLPGLVMYAQDGENADLLAISPT
jgi:hypothetical protein